MGLFDFIFGKRAKTEPAPASRRAEVGKIPFPRKALPRENAEAEILPFDVALARRELTSVSAGEWQRVAISLIEQGHDFPALHELAWDPVISHREAAVLFEAVMTALGWRSPSREEAVEILVRHHLTRIVEGRCCPVLGLQLLMNEVYWPEVSKFGSSVHVGDSHDLQGLIGCYWSYDDLFDSANAVGYAALYGVEAFRALGDQVRKVAAEWLTRHPTSSFHLAPVS